MSAPVASGGPAGPPLDTAEPTTGAPSGSGAPRAPFTAVPVHAEGLQLLGDMRGSGYRNPPALVRRADGQTLQLTMLLYLVLEAIDGRRSLAEVAAHASAAYGRSIGPEAVEQLVETKLRPLGTLRLADGSEPEVRRANPLLALRFRYAVTSPEMTRRITAPFAWLFHPLIVVAVVAGFIAATGWVLFDRGLGFATHQAFANPALLLAVFGITILSAGFHEFGHAAAARYGGATPGTIGAGLYLLWPAFYTDVTDSYRLGRAGRIRTDLGGVYFNAVLAVAIFGAWWITGWDALLLVIATQILQMIRQMPPLLRFDGYHLLADVTGVPDLYYRIKPTLVGLWPTRWGNAESKVLKAWAKAVVTIWVIVVVPFMLASVLLTVITVPRILATASSSAAIQWRAMVGHLGAGNLPAGLARLLGFIAVVLPIAGIGYMLYRMVRQLGTKVWRATDGKPARRAGAVIAAVAVLAALGFAWWPHGNYRPIQPYERGTIQDALPASFQPSDLQAGQSRTAVTIWPTTAGPLPTASHPVLALVLVPRPGTPAASTAPTWVFPFNRPAPPGPGDNQALAVNTTNGATVYDVSFALVWANASQPVLNRNESYALARCHDCRTTAVSFQVVLIVGDAHVVVPQNLSAAVNYDCVSCVTQALAEQLVITLPGSPSASETAAIDALWAQINAFGQHLQGLSFAQIQARIAGYESQIKAIITKYSPPATSPTTVAPATTVVSNPAGGQPTTTAAPSGSSVPSNSPGTTIAGSGAAGGSGTTTPTTAANTGSVPGSATTTPVPSTAGTSPSTTTAG